MDVREAFDIGQAIGDGIEALKRQPIGILLGSFLMTCTQGGGGGANPSAFNPDMGEGFDWDAAGDTGAQLQGAQLQGAQLQMDPSMFLDQFQGMEPVAMLAAAAVVLAIVLVLGLVLFAIRCFLEPGYLTLHRNLAATGQGAIEDLFSGLPHMGRIALWYLLRFVVGLGVGVLALAPIGLVVGVGVMASLPTAATAILAGSLALLFTLPMLIYVQLGLVFGKFAAVYDGCGPVAALERSWSMASGNRLHLLIYFVVLGIFTALGYLLCCVGVIATKGITDYGISESYLLHTRPGEVMPLGQRQ